MVQDYIKDGAFDWKMFWCKHKMPLILSVATITILAILVTYVDGISPTLKAITTMEIGKEVQSFLLLGTAIHAIFYSKSRASARSKERKETEE